VKNKVYIVNISSEDRENYRSKYTDPFQLVAAKFKLIHGLFLTAEEIIEHMDGVNGKIQAEETYGGNGKINGYSFTYYPEGKQAFKW
jgi:hypothetical protein